MKYVLDKNSNHYELMGGKAQALSKLAKIVDNIPDWFVLTYEGFDQENKVILQEAKEELEKKLSKFSSDEYFAIRSSAPNEDSKENSFAGQFVTFLYVKKEDVLDKVLDVYLSAFSNRVKKYRKENHIEEIVIPSVIIQKMINSRCAGVAFGANPVNSNVKESVVSAVFGLGSGLVDGIATADTYTIENNNIKKEVAEKDYYHVLDNGKVAKKKVEKSISNLQVLKDEEILEIVRLVKKASDFFGRFQDIEWAYEGTKLYLLQSRPITTLSNNKEGKVNLFDNTNIVENYGGITTPLTFSFIRMVYENVYIELCKIFNVKQEKIEMNSQMFKNMLGLIDGRVYYNLYGWYGMLSMFPGIGNNKKFMEQMMGVRESLPEELFPVPKETFKDKLGLMNTEYGLLKGFIRLRSMTEKFYSRLNAAIGDKNIQNMDLYELHDYYYELEKKLLHKWDAPIVNDFLAMIFYGKLKEKCRELFKEKGDSVHNDLLCGEGGVISSEPAKRIKELARLAKDNNELLELLENKDVLYVQSKLPQYPEFNKKINEYLDKFSDRCLEELKLETLTLKDDPSSLYSSIAIFARRIKDKEIVEIDEKKTRLTAEKKVNRRLKMKPFQKAKFNYLLKQARYTVRNRENLRFERTVLFGRIRELFLRIGFILASMNVIEDKRDIFYLEVDEILFYIDGKSTTNNLKELIEIRKKEYKKYQDNNPDNRFYSYGAVNIGNTFKRLAGDKDDDDAQESRVKLKGIGASPGIVKGKVRVIRNPLHAKLEEGEILVAEYTDPGWLMLFPAASGILVERGSLLSHSAIVSRELGIPAIVGIAGLTDALQDGDEVELDGTTGEVKIKKSKLNGKISNLRDLLEISVAKFGDNVLYELDKKEITYKEFAEKVKALGMGINSIGLKGKKIAILSENRYEWEMAFFAIALQKGVIVPIDKSLPEEDILKIINKTKAEAVFCSARYEAVSKEIKEKNEYLKYVIPFDSEKTKFFDELIDIGKNMTGKDEFEDDEINSKDMCLISFTSGTTEVSKPVMLTHKNICSNMLNVAKVFDIYEKDVCLSVLPSSHVLEGLFCFLGSINRGAKRIFCNEVDQIMEYIEKYKVNYMGAVPAIYEYLYKDREALEKASIYIKKFMSGGASLAPKLAEDYKKLGIDLVQGYGLTECGPVVSIETRDASKVGSVGKAIPNVEVKIVNENEDGIGEIVVKGDNVTPGYFESIKTTKDRIKDGYFYTGDLGRIDEDGFIYICGRNKETIVLENGNKVFPGELEALINKFEGVKECLVFQRRENKIAAKIVYDRESFYGKDENEVKEILIGKINELNKTLPRFKNVIEIFITEEKLERDEIGKIIRTQELGKIFTKEDEKFVDIKEKNIFDILKAILKQKLGVKEIKEKSDLTEDLMADSLDKAEIFLAVENEFNVKVTKEQRKKIQKVSDILDLVYKND